MFRLDCGDRESGGTIKLCLKSFAEGTMTKLGAIVLFAVGSSVVKAEVWRGKSACDCATTRLLSPRSDRGVALSLGGGVGVGAETM